MTYEVHDNGKVTFTFEPNECEMLHALVLRGVNWRESGEMSKFAREVSDAFTDDTNYGTGFWKHEHVEKNGWTKYPVWRQDLP